jgi:hypothetical protein
MKCAPDGRPGRECTLIAGPTVHTQSDISKSTERRRRAGSDQKPTPYYTFLLQLITYIGTWLADA